MPRSVLRQGSKYCSENRGGTMGWLQDTWSQRSWCLTSGLQWVKTWLPKAWLRTSWLQVSIPYYDKTWLREAWLRRSWLQVLGLQWFKTWLQESGFHWVSEIHGSKGLASSLIAHDTTTSKHSNTPVAYTKNVGSGILWGYRPSPSRGINNARAFDCVCAA